MNFLQDSNTVYGQKGERLIVSWKLLNQSYENNTSNIYFEAKFIPAQTLTSNFNYDLNIYTMTEYGMELIYGEEGENPAITVKAGEEHILFYWTENIEHIDRTVGQKIRFTYKLVNFRDAEGYKGFEAVIEGGFPPVTAGIELYNAPDFDDESNLTIQYTYNIDENYTNVQFGIATTTATTINPIIAYRDVALNDNTYTFEFTENEREALRQVTPSKSRELYVVSRGIYPDGTTNITTYLIGQVTLYIKATEPTIHSVEIEDVNPITLALTGDKNVYVNGYSEVEYSIAATASKQGQITNYSVYLGEASDEHSWRGEFVDLGAAANGTFLYYSSPYTQQNACIFEVIDSRDFATRKLINVTTVPYEKVTCDAFGVQIAMSDDDTTKGVARITIHGFFWDGNFGAADNTLKLELRHTQNDGSMGEWVDLTSVHFPEFFGDDVKKRYKFSVDISGFEHNGTYTFQARVSDKLSSNESSQQTVRITPVFDWGENDFRFNVPVNATQGLTADKIEAEDVEVAYSVGATSVFALSYWVGEGSDVEKIVDHVIAEGDNGSYAYRKWANGRLEAWRTATTTITATASQAYGSTYYTPDLTLNTTGGASQFVAIDSVQMTINRNGALGMWMPVVKKWEVDSDGKATITYSLFNPTELIASVIPCVYIMGRWK